MDRQLRPKLKDGEVEYEQGEARNDHKHDRGLNTANDKLRDHKFCRSHRRSKQIT